MEMYDIVKKLIGEVQPIGETNTDNTRYENLEVLTDLTEKLLTDIFSVGDGRFSHEFSLRRAGQYAASFLERNGID